MFATARGNPPVRWLHLGLIAALIMGRRPDALFHPQFWAEDGTLWYQGAYNIGVSVLLHPAEGYLQTISRLAAMVAVPFPLSWAPAIFAIMALCIQVLPAGILLSKRFDRLVPSWPGRIAMVYFYALAPNSYEWNMNITNAQWHLALAAFLIIIGAPATSAPIRVMDAAIVLLSGLSGPFAIFFAPFAVWEYYEERVGQRAVDALFSAIAAATQICCLFTTIAARPQAQLDANLSTLCRMLTDQIVLGGLLGARLTGVLIANPFIGSGRMAVFLTFAAGALLLTALRIGPSPYRKTLLFVGVLLAAALIRPATPANTWVEMAQLGSCDRYFIAPILIWFATLLVLSASKPILRQIATFLAIISLLGILFDFRYPTYSPTNFTARANQFAGAKTGTIMVFPENPPGWSMVLTKHSG